MLSKKYVWVITTICFSIITVYLLQFITSSVTNKEISMTSNETERFRELRMSKEAIKNWSDLSRDIEENPWKVLAVLMASFDFDLSRLPSNDIKNRYFTDVEYYETFKREELAALIASYEAIWADIQYFPIPVSTNPKAATIAYEDSWKGERNYKDTTHLHEGCDIMTSNNERGYFPVVSMTNGVVEQIGWLEKGGYRIGIRSPCGGYFYYAHLYRYAKDFIIGEEVKAGELLGFMGDSGYSKVEGTVGNFDVHLHLGIYIRTEHYEEISVNPYWVLKYIEGSRTRAAY